MVAVVEVAVVLPLLDDAQVDHLAVVEEHIVNGSIRRRGLPDRDIVIVEALPNAPGPAETLLRGRCECGALRLRRDRDKVGLPAADLAVRAL
jgi:hypothetical protein